MNFDFPAQQQGPDRSSQRAQENAPLLPTQAPGQSEAAEAKHAQGQQGQQGQHAQREHPQGQHAQGEHPQRGAANRKDLGPGRMLQSESEAQAAQAASEVSRESAEEEGKRSPRQPAKRTEQSTDRHQRQSYQKMNSQSDRSQKTPREVLAGGTVVNTQVSRLSVELPEDAGAHRLSTLNIGQVVSQNQKGGGSSARQGQKQGVDADKIDSSKLKDINEIKEMHLDYEKMKQKEKNVEVLVKAYGEEKREELMKKEEISVTELKIARDIIKKKQLDAQKDIKLKTKRVEMNDQEEDDEQLRQMQEILKRHKENNKKMFQKVQTVTNQKSEDHSKPLTQTVTPKAITTNVHFASVQKPEG